MKIKQIAIFLENKPGHLRDICHSLSSSGINITTLSLADTQQYGILRLIVKDWQAARDVLTNSGFIVNITEVLAVEVADRPGGLLEVLDLIGASSINIEYMYAFTFRCSDRAMMVFRFDDPDKAIELLQSTGTKVINHDDLFSNFEKA